MGVDELADEPAGGHDLAAAAPHVVERAADEHGAKPLSPSVGVDLGVGEHDPVPVDAVVGDPDELAIDQELVAGPVPCVEHLGGHGSCLPGCCVRLTGVTRKRLLGPAVRQPPRLDDELTDCTLSDVEPYDVLEDVRVDGGTLAHGVAGLEITRAELTGLQLTGLELTDLRLLDVVLVDCELSGASLSGARWERVVFRRCRMSGLVAAELQASDVRLDGCKLDQAWLRSAVLDRCELVDCQLEGADLYGARVTRTVFRRCDLTEVDVSASDFELVSLHGSTVDRLKGADALRGLVIGSDQLVPLALPILAARQIRVDDDGPDLVADP